MSHRIRLLGGMAVAIAVTTAFTGLGGAAASASTQSTACDSAHCPPGFSFATSEGQYFSTGTARMDLAFGAKGHFTYLYNRRGVFLCALSTFGSDPAPYTPKFCSMRRHTGTSMNLVINGNFEDGPGTTSSGVCVSAPGWVDSDGPTVVQYGSVGFPSKSDAGPNNRGNNFAAGGPTNSDGNSAWIQLVSLARFANSINSGNVTFNASGWFGGYQDEGDYAELDIAWWDAGGNGIGSPVRIGDVTPADRGNRTGLLFRSEIGAVPRGAAYANVYLAFHRTHGTYNDGYADNIALTISGI